MKNLFALKILNKMVFQLLVDSPFLKFAHPWSIFFCLFAVLMMHSQKSYSVEIITQGYFKAGGPGSDIWNHTPYFPGAGTEEQQNSPEFNPDVACAQYGMRLLSVSEVAINGVLYSNGFSTKKPTYILNATSSRRIFPFFSSWTYDNSYSTAEIESFGNIYPKHKAAYIKTPFTPENERQPWDKPEDIEFESMLGTILEFSNSSFTDGNNFVSINLKQTEREKPVPYVGSYIYPYNDFFRVWLAEVSSKEINPNNTIVVNPSRMLLESSFSGPVPTSYPSGKLVCVEDLY